MISELQLEIEKLKAENETLRNASREGNMSELICAYKEWTKGNHTHEEMQNTGR